MCIEWKDKKSVIDKSGDWLTARSLETSPSGENYKLIKSADYICLKIVNYGQMGCGLVFMAGVGLFMFLSPIITILFVIKELSFGVVMSCLLGWIISGYFIKIYLWNRYGEEVFIIKDKTFETYQDYKFFKDNHKLYHTNKIDILYYVGDDVNIDYRLIKSQLSVVGFELDEETITSHREIPIPEIKNIAQRILDFRQNRQN